MTREVEVTVKSTIYRTYLVTVDDSMGDEEAKEFAAKEVTFNNLEETYKEEYESEITEISIIT